MKQDKDPRMSPQGIPGFKDRISRRTHDSDGLPLAVGRFQFVSLASFVSSGPHRLGVMIDTVTGKLWNVEVGGYFEIEAMEKSK